MNFPLGTYYHIIAGTGAGQRALSIETTNYKHFHNARVIGVRPDANDPAQLFMLDKTGLEDDSWEIINCISNNVFDEESGEIRLKKGKRIADQLFKLQNMKDDQYWIKCDDDGTMAVCLEGIIRYRKFNNNDRAQIFRFKPIQSEIVNQSYVLVNSSSGKALDVPSGSFEPDTRLIQFTLNKRFNQRWIFIKKNKGYLIRSLLNGLAIDIANESNEEKSAVIQWDANGSPNQLWIPRPTGSKNCFKMESVHAPGMFLCIKNESMADFGQLEIRSQDSPSMHWRIDGFGQRQ